jgi:two-component system CheB/CheR fusion protein
MMKAVKRDGLLQGMRILLVEDSKDVRDAFAMLLRTDGATVVAVNTGRKGIEAAERGGFDIVLSDYGLPDIAGDDLVRALVTRAGPKARTVVVTGYGEPYVSRARRAGAEAVFTKPVEWSRVLSFLKKPARAA